MPINHEMKTPIASDPNHVKMVVDEAKDGKKAIPTELVVKKSDDSTFEQVSATNGLPVQLTGSYVGYSNEEKPMGNKGDSFLELDTQEVYIYDGSKWVLF